MHGYNDIDRIIKICVWFPDMQTIDLLCRHTGTQTDRQTDIRAHRQIDRQTDRHTGTQTDRQTDIRAHRQIDKKQDRHLQVKELRSNISNNN